MPTGRYSFANDANTPAGAISDVSVHTRGHNALAAWEDKHPGRSFEPIDDANSSDNHYAASISWEQSDNNVESELRGECKKQGVQRRPYRTFEEENRWLGEVRLRKENGEDIAALKREVDKRKEEWGDSDDGLFSMGELTKLLTQASCI